MTLSPRLADPARPSRFSAFEPRRSSSWPRRSTGLVLGLLSLALLSLGTACATGTAERAAGLPSGINDTFLAEDMNVDEYVERFEGESRDVYAQRQPIVEAMQLAPGASVADIGAGTGFFSFLFADAVTSTGKVHAVEISPRFLDHLRTEVRERELAQMEVVEGDERTTGLAADSIDLAFICDVYHHFEYPEDTLASLHAAIRPGGSLVLIDFERIPGKSPKWLLDHVRAGREVFQAEIEAAGFRLSDEIELDGLEDNYILRFERID